MKTIILQDEHHTYTLEGYTFTSGNVLNPPYLIKCNTELIPHALLAAMMKECLVSLEPNQWYRLEDVLFNITDAGNLDVFPTDKMLYEIFIAFRLQGFCLIDLDKERFVWLKNMGMKEKNES